VARITGSTCAFGPAFLPAGLHPSPPTFVLFGIFGRTTNANDLKDALDVSAQRTRMIASRVSQASLNNGSGFALPIDPATGQPAAGGDVDMESEMTALADEQVRYDATEKLLEKAYAPASSRRNESTFKFSDRSLAPRQ
jgi:hypothetical protein